MTIFILLIIIILVKKHIQILLFVILVYLVIGIVVFCYLLIEELRSLNKLNEPRPDEYYSNHIGTMIIILNISTGVFKIASSVVMICYLSILKIEKRRMTSESNHVNFINQNDNEKRESMLKLEEEEKDYYDANYYDRINKDRIKEKV